MHDVILRGPLGEKKPDCESAHMPTSLIYRPPRRLFTPILATDIEDSVFTAIDSQKIHLTFDHRELIDSTLRRPAHRKKFRAKENAPAANRTRGPSMATMDFTTKPLALQPTKCMVSGSATLIKVGHNCQIPTLGWTLMALNSRHLTFSPDLVMNQPKSLYSCHNIKRCKCYLH